MQRHVDWSRAKAERQFLARQAVVASCAGRMREAGDLCDRVIAIDERNHATDAVAAVRAGFAVSKAMVGDAKGAIALADSAASVPAAWPHCVTAYAFVGDQARADRLLARLAAGPTAGFRSYDVEPVTAWFKGVLLMKQGKPEEALQPLRTAARYEGAPRYDMWPNTFAVTLISTHDVRRRPSPNSAR